MTAIGIPSACLASSIVLIGNKTSMFEVKIRLALKSLFYPPQAIHVYGVDLYNDGRCLLKNLLMELIYTYSYIHTYIHSYIMTRWWTDGRRQPWKC